MANVNKVMLLGNITRDLEVRYTPKGTAVCDLGMAVNRIRTGDNGERIEEVTYVDIDAFGQAELAGQYLSNGRSVFIEGRLQLDQWDDKQTGQKRSRLRVVGENMQFIGGQGGNQGGSSAPRQQAPPSEQQQAPPSEQQQAPPQSNQGGAAAAENFDNDDDDIPF